MTVTNTFIDHGLWNTDELYDLQSDPLEIRNLINLAQHAATVKEMNRRLFETLTATEGLYIPLYPDHGGQLNDRRRGGKWAANIWQGRFPSQNTSEDGCKSSAPVTAFAPKGFGLYDVGGNVWQSCSDWYRPDYFVEQAAQGATRNPQGPPDSHDPQEPGIPKRVQKSGSFLCSDQYCSRYLVGSRGKGATDSGSSNVGFRCVKAAA